MGKGIPQYLAHSNQTVSRKEGEMLVKAMAQNHEPM